MIQIYFSILIYPVLAVFLLTLFGVGFTTIVLPKNLRTYTILLSPWISILFSICFLVIVSLLGFSVHQVSPILISFFVGVDIFIFVFHRRKIQYSIIRDGILLMIVLLSLVVHLSPLLRREKILTTISMGNNDVIVYAAVADYLKDHSISESFQKKVPYEVGGLLYSGYRWGTPMINAFFLNLFNLQGYQYTYASQVVLFSLFLPLSYILFELLFRKSFIGMIALGIFTACNANLTYMLYHDFFGQVLFWGIEMMFMIFLYAYVQSSELKKNMINIFDYCIAVIISVLFFSYHEPAILLLLPIIISIVWYFFIDRRKAFMVLMAGVRIGLIAFIISSVSIVNAIIIDYLQAFVSYKDQPIGWELFRAKIPFANPFEAMGFYSIHSFSPLPNVIAIILSCLTILVICTGLIKSRTKVLSVAFVTTFITFYYWTAIAQHNFFAYNRALTYTIPFIIVLFTIGLSALYKMKKIIILFIFLLLFCLELYSGRKLLSRYMAGRLAVDASYISLLYIQNTVRITEPVFIENQLNSTIPYWNLIWTNYFFTLNNPPIKIGSLNASDNTIPDNSLVLISKKPRYYRMLNVVLKDIIWENEYYKIGKLCSEEQCLQSINEDLSQISIGNNTYEDSLLLSGWGSIEGDGRWVTTKRAEVRLMVENNATTKLTLEALTLKEPQSVEVSIDGEKIGSSQLSTEWKKYEYLSPHLIKKGLHTITFDFQRGYIPAEVLSENFDKRILYAKIRKIAFE